MSKKKTWFLPTPSGSTTARGGIWPSGGDRSGDDQLVRGGVVAAGTGGDRGGRGHRQAVGPVGGGTLRGRRAYTAELGRVAWSCVLFLQADHRVAAGRDLGVRAGLLAVQDSRGRRGARVSGVVWRGSNDDADRVVVCGRPAPGRRVVGVLWVSVGYGADVKVDVRIVCPWGRDRRAGALYPDAEAGDD